jgi:hypothetical protein
MICLVILPGTALPAHVHVTLFMERAHLLYGVAAIFLRLSLQWPGSM